MKRDRFLKTVLGVVLAGASILALGACASSNKMDKQMDSSMDKSNDNSMMTSNGDSMSK
jgi:heme O synthase-like polyprenyltransferase